MRPPELLSRLVLAFLVIAFPAFIYFPALASPPPTSPLVANATLQVNTTLDTPDADPLDGVCADAHGQCSLRAAIMQANFTPGTDTIVVPAGIYLLTRVGLEDNALAGDLDITDDLAIQGAGSALTVIDGNGAVTGDRVFQALSSVKTVSLSGMTIRNGKAPASGTSTGDGGGIYMEGTGHLQLSDVLLQGNAASNGGGLYASLSAQGGSIDLEHVVLHANKALSGGVGAGGGMFASVLSSSSTIGIRDSQVYSNTVDGTGGGLFIEGTDLAHWTLDHSEVYSNTAASGGGLGNFLPLALTDSRLHGNRVSFDGGAIEAFSPLSVSRSLLDANSAGRYGGAIFSLATGNTPLYHNFLDVQQSTLSGNFAKDGGGIYHDGYINNNSLLTLANSTVSGNSVFRGYGGGLYSYQGHTFLSNTTIAHNHVQLTFPTPGPYIGGGLYITVTSVLTAENSIIADNNRGNGILVPTPDDCYSHGTTGQLAYNLFGTMANCFVTGGQVGNIVGPDPLLGPLQNNGGFTPTHELQPNSPAIDAGSNLICPAFDQRGVPRPYDGNADGSAICDMGAYEVSANQSQSILFASLQTMTLADSPFVVTATASSGLTVSFSSSTAGICTVSASTVFAGTSAATVTLKKPGSCTLVAQQPGSSTFTPAASVPQTFAVEGELFLPILDR